MIFPNKITPYEESVLSNIPIVYSLILGGINDVFELYNKLSAKFDSVNNFIYALDLLFLLDRIEPDERGKLHAKEHCM